MKPQPVIDPRSASRPGRAGPYHSVENRSCVLRPNAPGHRDLVTVVGHVTTIAAGEWTIKRLALAETFSKLPPCVVGMEACLSHFVSQGLRQLGHEPTIIPAIYVKPFVKGQKNDLQ